MVACLTLACQAPNPLIPSSSARIPVLEGEGPALVAVPDLAAVVVLVHESGYTLHLDYPDGIVINEPAQLELAITKDNAPSGVPPSVQQFKIDAFMPAHGHGQVRDSVLTEFEPNRWRVEDFLLHMPGEWLVRVQMLVDGRRLRFDHRFSL